MIKTRRWTRSPRGCVFGVVTGLAEWRSLPVDMTRLVVFLILVCTAIFPGILIYLALALVLPEQTDRDIVDRDDRFEDSYNDFFSRRADYRRARRTRSASYTDATFREAGTTSSAYKTDEDLRKEYEELKKKVEEMENDMFDKEKDWDNRFKD